MLWYRHIQRNSHLRVVAITNKITLCINLALYICGFDKWMHMVFTVFKLKKKKDTEKIGYGFKTKSSATEIIPQDYLEGTPWTAVPSPDEFCNTKTWSHTSILHANKTSSFNLSWQDFQIKIFIVCLDWVDWLGWSSIFSRWGLQNKRPVLQANYCTSRTEKNRSMTSRALRGILLLKQLHMDFFFFFLLTTVECWLILACDPLKPWTFTPSR